MQKSNKDHHEKVKRIIERIKYNSDKLVRLENRVDRIKSKEIRFQAQVAILNHYQDEFLRDTNETGRNLNREEGTS